MQRFCGDVRILFAYFVHRVFMQILPYCFSLLL
nr:MAG TPA: hypothetical protein [Caudoviricetes sp.]